MNTPEFAAAQPHLHIDNKVICRHFLPALQEQAALPAYHDYLCKKFEWTRADIKTVHWTALHHAIQNSKPNDQHRIVLFINKKLPLRTSKAHPHPGSQLCPLCQCEPEDSQHFLQCDHLDRCQLFEQLHRNLTETANKYGLHPSLITAIWLGLLAIRTATPYPAVQHKLPLIIAIATTSQTQLGWDQLYYGWFSIYWANAIDQLHPQLALAGRQIITVIIQALWSYVLETWSLQNKHLHNDMGAISLPNYQHAVQTMYQLCHQLPPDTQAAIFSWPLEALLLQLPEYLRNWIIRSNKYMQKQLKAAKKGAKLNTPDIRSFFCPCNPVNNDLHPP